MNLKACIVSSSLVLSLIACGGAPDGASGPAGEPLDAAPVTRTVVTRAADGTQTAKTEVISRETQLKEIAARTAYVEALRHPVEDGVGKVSSAISYDTGCGGASLWLFDGENLTGNEICFIGAGDANLSSYADGPAICGSPTSPCQYPTWSRSVRSLWAGIDAGYLVACYGVFHAWERQDTLSTAARGATSVTLTAGDLCPIH